MPAQKRVQDVMTPNPSCVTPQTKLQEAAQLMKDENVGIIPVVESDDSRKLVGLLTDRDIAIRVVAEGRDVTSTSVGQVMSQDVKTCRMDDDVNDVMNLMGEEQVRRVPIVDDRGSLVGIVSQADVVLEGPAGREAHRVVQQISEPSGKHAQ